jgi:sterol desaturase/sphingolipid hydroxylase (fatty acid hydroxylase superfamily)
MELTSIEQVLNKYMLAALIIWIGSLVLCSPETPWYQTTFGIGFMHIWVYWVHRSLHYVTSDTLLGFLNTHLRFHHQFDKPICRELELFFEVIVDLLMNFSLLFLQMLTGYYIVPVPIIVLFALSYTSVHLINYSIVGNEVHRRHHLTFDKNFGPDVSDHLFGTNFNNEVEDISFLSINALWITLILYPLKEYFWWPK